MADQEKYQKIVIALAGALQAVALVKEIAQTGKVQEQAFEASIYSIFQTEPHDLQSIFGGLTNLQLGLQKVLTQFNPNPDAMLTRYLLSIIHLQKKLARSASINQQLTKRLSQIKKQVDYFSLMHPLVITNLADVYNLLVSHTHFKIVIWGNERMLKIHENMEKIRALLFSGIRSVVLWRQVGGSRFQFLFSRAKIKSTAAELINMSTLNTRNMR